MSPIARGIRNDPAKDHLRAQAEAIAEIHAFYIECHTLSSEYLRSDITRRDRMLEDFSQSPNAMTFNSAPPSNFKDYEQMIAKYDSELAKDPVTFEDHFNRMHYAYSALILHQINVCDQAMAENPQMVYIYAKHAKLLNDNFMEKHYPSPASDLESGPATMNQISTPNAPIQEAGASSKREEEALEILRDHIQLMRLKFVLLADTSSEGQWRVDGVNLRSNNKTEYIVQFSNCPELFPMQQTEIVHLLCDSTVIA